MSRPGARAVGISVALSAILAAWCGTAVASPPDTLDTLVSEAKALEEQPPRFVKDFKQGIRSVTYSSVTIAPSDPSVIYITSLAGYVFGSRDRGTTWNEGRLIVSRRRFYGSIRPAPIGSGAPFSLSSNIGDLHSRGHLTFDIDNLLTYPQESTGSQLLDVSIDAPAFYPSQLHPELKDPSDIKLYDEAGAGAGGGDLARLGVGLKTAAVYLAALLRKRHMRVLSMNLQLTLAIKGAEPTGIQWSAVHPERPNEVLAASHMGLWRSEDYGMSWILAFPGATYRERTARHVSYRPDDPSVVLLATDQGIRVSHDGGHSFEPIKGTQLSTARARWIEWSPSHPDTVYVGSTIGVFRSDDGGRIWRWIYFETLPSQNHITGIVIDPADRDRVMLSTHDGLFRSDNGGETWERAGGLLFTGIKVRDITTNPRDGKHVICITNRQVWESRDWGETWSAVYLNDSEWWFRQLRFDPHEEDVFWVVSSNEVLRISPSRVGNVPRGGLATFQERIAVEPSLWETMEATFKTLGIHLGEHADARDLAGPSAWIPSVNLMAGVMAGEADAQLAHNLLSKEIPSVEESSADPNQPDEPVYPRRSRYSQPEEDAIIVPDALIKRTQSLHEFYAFAVFQWDFGRATFDLDSVPYGRIFNTASYRYRKIRAEVQRLYEERRRLLLELLTSPKRDLAGDLFLKLRLEELTAHLNAFSGGLWSSSAHWLSTLP